MTTSTKRALAACPPRTAPDRKNAARKSYANRLTFSRFTAFYPGVASQIHPHCPSLPTTIRLQIRSSSQITLRYHPHSPRTTAPEHSPCIACLLSASSPSSPPPHSTPKPSATPAASQPPTTPWVCVSPISTETVSPTSSTAT